MNDDRTLLLLDDDDVFASRMAKALSARGFGVTRAATAAEAIASAREESPEYALVDLRLPTHGLDVVAELHAIDQTTRIVVLTGYGAIATAVESLKRGASDYLTKPIDADRWWPRWTRRRTLPEGAREFTVPSLACRGGSTSSGHDRSARATCRRLRASSACTALLATQAVEDP
jgi:two-component system response regulator RegA